MTSPGMEKTPISETHRVVYPPLLLQEQLVFAVVVVQALVWEREMLLQSSAGEEVPVLGMAGLRPPHPCIFFLP